MALPLSYSRKFSEKIANKQNFIANLNKNLPKQTSIKQINNTFVFSLRKALLPFSYEVQLTFDKDTLIYEVNLSNLFFIDFIFSFLLLFIIKNLLLLTGIIISLFLVSYGLNIFHINIVLEHIFHNSLTDKKAKIICPQCFAEVKASLEYCPHCGAPLKIDTTNSEIKIKYIIK